MINKEVHQIIDKFKNSEEKDIAFHTEETLIWMSILVREFDYSPNCKEQIDYLLDIFKKEYKKILGNLTEEEQEKYIFFMILQVATIKGMMLQDCLLRKSLKDNING